MTRFLSFDIGGTKTSYCIVDEKGKMCSEINKCPTAKTVDELFNNFCRIAKENEGQFDYISFATAGAVNLENTLVRSSTPNMPEGYRDLDFSLISPKKVFVENDANAAAWGEYRTGAGRGYKNVIVITLGTGIGGGIILNGKLLRGKSGKAGEVGSIKINTDKVRECTCHNFDCWEAYASGTGMKETIKYLAKTSPSFRQGIYKDAKIEDITTRDIIQSAKNGDKFAIEVFETWQHHVQLGLISLVNIFDPEVVILSGGMGEVVDYEKMEKEINDNIVVSPIKLLPAELKNNAGMVGAALLAYETLELHEDNKI